MSRPPGGPDGATRTNAAGPGVLSPDSRLAGRYRVRELLGVGAMGMVYRVYDELLDLDVALKVLRPELAGSREVSERFRRELVLARQVTHPNVVRIHDLGEDDGAPRGQARHFLTMDLVPGRSLRQVLSDEGPLAPARAVAIARQLAAALDAAHRQGVVHRDLKPANVLVDTAGEARITDFGVARSLSVSGAETLTREGGVVGTPQYLSPEQARGEPVDGRSDLYAVGLMLFEMLTGELPFTGSTFAETLAQRLSGTPRTLAECGCDVSPRLEAIVARCLAREPADRYEDAAALECDLASLQSGGGRARIGRGRRLVRVRGRGGALLAAGLAAVVVAATVAGLFWWHGRGEGAGASSAAEGAQDGSSTAGAGQGETAVAVLPLADETGRAELAWAPAGIAQSLADELAESPTLRVVPAERVARTVEAVGFGGGVPPPADAGQLAELLDADLLVTGALRAEGDRLWIDGRLIGVSGSRAERGPSARKERHGSAGAAGAALRVETAPGEGVLALVGRFGAAVRRRLNLDGPAPAASPTTDSAEALAAYGEGVERLVRGDAVEALPRLQAAVTADPGFAAAWVRLAAAQEALGHHDEALDAVRRGLQALPSQPDGGGRLGYEARAREAILGGDPETAQAALADLLERYPHDEAARMELAAAYGEAGRYDEASGLLQKIVAEEPSHPRAWYLLGKYAILAGDSRRAADEYLVRALVIQNRLGNDQGRADVLNALGIAFDDLGERGEAVARYQQAAELRRKIGDRRGTAATLTNLGVLQFLGGDYARGRARLDEALSILRELGDPAGEAGLRNELGVLEEERGHYADALEHYRRALAIRDDLGDRRAQAESDNNVGFAYYLLGELDNARVYWRRALELYRQSDNREGVVIVTQSVAQLDLVRGRWSEALKAFVDTLEQSKQLDLPDAEAVALGNLGRIAQLQGRYGAALDSYGQALSLVGSLDDARGQAEYGLFRASALLDLGAVDPAEEALDRVGESLGEVGNREQTAEHDRLLGRLALARGDLAAARGSFERASGAARESGSRMAELGARLGLARVALAGHEDGAIETLQSVVDEAGTAGYLPLRLEVSVVLGRALLAAGRPRDAGEVVRRALREAGDGAFRERWRLEALLALALERRGAPEEAGPHWAAAVDDLGRVRHDLEQTDETERRAFEALPEVREVTAHGAGRAE